jgi:hypothetical protein
MKNYSLIILMAVFSIFMYTDTRAQSETDNTRMPVFGIGLHVEQFKVLELVGDYAIFTTKVLLPLNLSQHFRIEPEVGFLWMNNKDDELKDLGISSGLGIFGMFQRDKVNFYAGGRVGYNAGSSEGNYMINDETVTQKFITIRVGPTIGFEYFFSRNFSFGGEAGVSYSYVKNKIDYPVIPDYPELVDEESTASSLGFESGLFMRAYF